MNNSSRLLPLFVLFGFFVVTLLPTQAQTKSDQGGEPEPAVSPDQPTSRVVAVADVNVTDVKVVEKDGILSGTFALQGKMGQQNDIVYGVMVTGAENEILDIHPLGQVASVKQGEIKTIAIEYRLPDFLKGQVQVMLQAETLGGLPLGTQILLNKDLGGTMESTLTCLSAENGFSCTSTLDQTVTVQYFTGSVFSQSVESSELALVANTAVDVQPTLKPGRYTAIARKNDGTLALASFRVAGNFGQIQSVVLSTDDTGKLVGSVVAAAFPLAGAKVTIVLRSESDEVCGQGEAFLRGQVAEIVFTEVGCIAGIAETTLTGENGSVLASLSQAFNTSEITSTNALSEVTNTVAAAKSGMGINWFKWLLWLGVVVVLGILALVRGRALMKKSERVMPKLFLLAFIGLSSFAMAQPTRALTLVGEGTIGYRGEVGYVGYGSVTSDRPSYAPGENMILTANLSVYSDAGAGGSSTTSVAIMYDRTGSEPAWDTPWIGASPVQMLYTGIFGMENSQNRFFTSSRTVTIPASMSTASHYLPMRLSMCSSYPNLPPWPACNPRSETGNFTFNVAPASSTPCSFNGTVNWGAGTNVFPGSECTGNINVSGVPVGESRTVTDSDGSGSGYTGSSTFRCDSGPSGWSFAGSTCARAPTMSLSSFSPNPITAGTGQSSSVTLSTTNADTCTYSGSAFGSGSVPAPGPTPQPFYTSTTLPANNYDVTVTCTGPGGSVGPQTRTLTVNSAVINGVCGADNRATLATTPTSWCTSGSQANNDAYTSDMTFDANDIVASTGSTYYVLGWYWQCNGSSGGTSRGCRASHTPSCGSANGGTFGFSTPPADPTTGPKQVLCTWGTPTTVNSTATTYTWQCNNGTAAAVNCSATRSSGSPPTVDITADVVRVSAVEKSWWGKMLGWVTGYDRVARANHTTANISTSGSAQLSWTSSGATACSISGPGWSGSSVFNGNSPEISGASLSLGTNTYTIQCSNAFGTSTHTADIVVSNTSPPSCCGGTGDTPPNLRATPRECNSGTIDISWGAIPGATSYTLRDGSTIIDSGSDTGYVHAGLTANSPHSYTIVANGPNGSSFASSPVSATAPAVCSGPINGACAITHNNCNAGTSANPTEDASFWYWQCLGIGAGSTTASCQEAKTASTYFIDSSVSGSGGSIAPLGRVSGITAGSSQSYTITPNPGYNINSVIVDGANLGPQSSYTFTNITANHSIVASFASLSSQVISFGNDGPIRSGSSATLSYTVQGWDLCEITRIPQSTALGGPFSGNLGSGSRRSDTLTADQTYRLRCWVIATGQQDIRDTTVSVTAGSGSTINVLSKGTNASSFVVRELPFFNAVLTMNQGTSYELLTLMGTDPASTTIAQPFYDSFAYSWDTNTNWQPINQTLRTAPAPSGDAWDFSSTFTPTRGGTLYLRHCVDETNVLAETNEGDNCTERSLTVTGSGVSGSLTSFTNPCVIPIGQGSCAFTAAWTTSFVDADPNAVFVGIRNSTNTLSQTVGFPTPSTYTWPSYVTGPPDTWTVHMEAGPSRGNAPLDSRTFEVRCADGSAWVSGLGCQPLPTVTLTVTNTVTGASATNGGSLSASPGQNLRLDWTVLNATSCSASDKWTGSKNNLGGTETQSAAVPSGDYVLACDNAAGTTSVRVTLNLACTPSDGIWSACGPPCAGGEGTRTRTRVTATCLSTPEEERCTASVCRDLNWKEVGQ